MATVKQHYDTHLADFYSWMAGDFALKQKEFQQFLKKHDIVPGSAKVAVDLGAGHGIQSVALAKMEFKVKAIDFNQQLLDELKVNGKDLGIEVINDDIRSIIKYLDQKPGVVVCWGDTLTHLDDLADVEHLLVNCCDALDINGKFILSFRDYTQELTADRRFIPVKSDENRILTCILEYSVDHVRVTDLLYAKGENGWEQKVSSYHKVRIPVSFVRNCLEKNGMVITFEGEINRLIAMIAIKSH